MRTSPPIDLAAFAREHLRYEAQMLLGGLTIVPRTPFEMNLKTECCALHLRNLLDFFYLDTPKRDDVIAAHYFADWEATRPAITPLLQRTRIRANKEMAHLTAARIAGTPERKQWDFPAVCKDLKGVIVVFTAHVDPMRIPKETIFALNQIGAFDGTVDRR